MAEWATQPIMARPTSPPLIRTSLSIPPPRLALVGPVELCQGVFQLGDRRLHDIGDGPIESPRQPGRALLKLRRAPEVELCRAHRPAAALLLGELRPALVPCPRLPRRLPLRA